MCCHNRTQMCCHNTINTSTGISTGLEKNILTSIVMMKNTIMSTIVAIELTKLISKYRGFRISLR